MQCYSAQSVAEKLGLKAKQALSWFWWTFLLGYPSFRWLLMLLYEPETQILLLLLLLLSPACVDCLTLLLSLGRDCNKKAKTEGKDLSQLAAEAAAQQLWDHKGATRMQTHPGKVGFKSCDQEHPILCQCLCQLYSVGTILNTVLHRNLLRLSNMSWAYATKHVISFFQYVI